METESIQDLVLVTGIYKTPHFKKRCLSFSVFKVWVKAEIYHIRAAFREELVLCANWGGPATSQFMTSGAGKALQKERKVRNYSAFEGVLRYSPAVVVDLARLPLSRDGSLTTAAY